MTQDAKEKITIICSKPGCPRKIKTDREDTDPKEATTMKMACPWHEGWNGEFDTPTYYDKDGKELLCDQEEANL